MSTFLCCNRCWTPFQTDEKAFVSVCLHVFCDKDFQSWFSVNSECPACKKLLNAQKDIRAIKVGPSMNLGMLYGMPNENSMQRIYSIYK